MDMRQYEELEEKLCKELEKIAKQNEYDMGDIEAINKLTDSIKNIKKIDMYSEGHSNSYNSGRGYSREGNSYNGGNYSQGRYSQGRYSRNSYGNGRQGTHYVGGYYSRGEDDKSMMMDRIREMMEDGSMTMEEKNTLGRAIEVLERK